ncbi:MAG: hypothetical protein AB1861_21880, partial [Cyanobacteriota bacterium]
KTTMLLELAQDLILGAQQQPEKPIPVIFELSSWKDDKQAIADWLVADLKFRNNIPEAITREWLETGKLLPLLDGLDELQSRQGQCIERINEFLQATSQLSEIVICCREEEYKTGEEILTLQGAVCLKPLEEKQVQNYLQRLNCEHLWHGMQNDPDGLLALAKIPLFLHLIPLAYPNGLESKAKCFNSPTELEAYQEKCRKDLFDAYIQLRLEQSDDCQGYKKEDTERWLIWLAKTLTQQNQKDFFIEKIQPIFSSPSKLNFIFHLIIGIIGLILGATYGLNNGLILGLVLGTSNNKIELSEELNTTLKKTRNLLLILSSLCIITGLINFLIFSSNYLLILGLTLLLTFGLGFETAFWIIFALISEKIKTRDKPNQGIIESAKNTIIISGISLPLCMLVYGVLLVASGQSVEPMSTVIIGLYSALLVGIIFAGLPVIQHFALRLILWKSGAIPWNYARFLSYANERRLIKQVGGRYRFVHDLLREHFAKM